MSVSIIASGFAGAGVVALHNGKHVVEAFTTYLKPPNGPYEEIHVLDPSPIPQANASFYGSHTETTAGLLDLWHIYELNSYEDPDPVDDSGESANQYPVSTSVLLLAGGLLGATL
ncbi:hypothetical protein EG329_005845 [Mollisiaceae sp. DMI_Dod_QoI]|nr:hypothetical protein EG329_005845 [Helotiales sp. DMI_Dod_QoI]